MLRWLALAITLQLLTAGALLTSSTVTLTYPAATIGDDSTDLYGNDVTPAVATYSLDAAGAVYELHSPQTEIPRLGSPKS